MVNIKDVHDSLDDGVAEVGKGFKRTEKGEDIRNKALGFFRRAVTWTTGYTTGSYLLNLSDKASIGDRIKVGLLLTGSVELVGLLIKKGYKSVGTEVEFIKFPIPRIILGTVALFDITRRTIPEGNVLVQLGASLGAMLVGEGAGLICEKAAQIGIRKLSGMSQK